MCDYSLQNVRSRPAGVDDRLVTRDFGTGTRGFASLDDTAVAVCVLPGTEIAFTKPIRFAGRGLLGWLRARVAYDTAIFRQINTGVAHCHHDALEFSDGRTVLLTNLGSGHHATVLQLPATPKNAADARAQQRVDVAG
jgi:hypothetical protein